MAESAPKKQKTEETPAEEAPAADETMEAAAEEAPAPEPELEKDAPADKGAKLKEPVAFNTEDTTMNVMPSSVGSILMPLTDGGLQYLLAGVRANVGVKSGRYMFEVKVLEAMNPADDPAARQRTPMPRNQLRIGFSTAGSSLFLGDDADGICFDTEGALIHAKSKTATKARFGAGCVVAVLLNLDKTSPNANTVSLFVNGERACAPQALPDALKGKTLCPAMTFKNMTLHYNFGPTPLTPLPFACRMVGDAAAKDVQVSAAATQDGQHEVLFPVCLPDEGTFDWLDMFLVKNPQYTELSDRAILSWAEKSGLWRPKGYAQKSSQDKPEMGFGISVMDDGSVRRVLQAVAPIQARNYVVMEVKSNLVKEERRELASKWAGTGFKRTATVMLGEPPAAVKKHFQELILKDKQEKSDAEFRAKKEEEKKKKELEKRQKKLEKEKKKQAKKLEDMKKKNEFDKKKKEAEEKGEEPPVEEEPASEEEEPEEEEKDDADMEEPPKVQLTPEEKKQTFRKATPSDLTQYALNTAFMKFSVPDKDEGFDEIKGDWAALPKCKDYVRNWIQEKKTTTRIEELTPGEWFQGKFKDWQKTLQVWHAKQNAYKAAVAKKAADKAAREAKKAAKIAAKEMKEKAAVELKAKKAAAKANAKEGEEVPEQKEDEPMEEEKEEPEEPEEKEEPRVDFDKLDVFGVENILDVGAGEPLFTQFGFEDWTMMSLRFELHLLTHSFKRDVNDQDRQGIHLDHLAFYYNKYFKKALNTKFYGVDTIAELLELVRDTVVATKGKVVEAQLPDDMESVGIFVMLTEEMRRDRTRRVDLGDESARLKLSQGGATPGMPPGGFVRPQMPGIRPSFPGAAPAAGWVRPPQQPWQPRPAGGMVRPWGAWRG